MRFVGALIFLILVELLRDRRVRNPLPSPSRDEPSRRALDPRLAGSETPAPHDHAQSNAHALYQTLSTTATTLAAAFAVVVALALFRIEPLTEAIDHAQDRLSVREQRDRVPRSQSLPILRDKGYEALKEFMESRGVKDVENERFEYTRGHDAWARRRVIIRRLWVSLALSGSTIALCLVMIPCVPNLAKRAQPCVYIATGVPIVLAVVSLGLYAWLVLGVVGSALE